MNKKQLNPDEMQIVQKHKIRNTHKSFKLLMEFCYRSKCLANQVIHEFREALDNKTEFPTYCELDDKLKDLVEYNAYRNMPTAQCAQQTITLICKNWKSFLRSCEEYKSEPEKFKAPPRPQKYYKKNGHAPLILTNQNCKLRSNGIIDFPKVFDEFSLTTDILKRDDFISFNQVRLLPHKDYIVAEVVFTVRKPKQLKQNERYIAIDLGVNNLATVCSNVDELKPFIITGKDIKWIDQYCNKQVAHYKSLAKTRNGLYHTNRIEKLFNKRKDIVTDLLHQKSRQLIDICIEHDISKIIIGYNKGWKQNVELGKTNNQNFVQIPHLELVKTIEYKAELQGIEVIRIDESYTSGTSFLDNELPDEENYDISRRTPRGIFTSNKGIKINSDLNAAYQIMRKVFPNAFDHKLTSNEIEGVVLHPVILKRVSQ